MDKISFAEQFRPNIGVCMHWDRILRDSTFKVRIAQEDTHSLSKFFAPWYLNQDQARTTWDGEHARPVSIVEAAALPNEFYQDRCFNTIRYWREQFRDGALIDMFPAYTVSDGFLVLDGNHRLVALARSGLAATFSFATIEGPIDDQAVFDLHYWQGLLHG